MCDHCFNAADIDLPNASVCVQCFHEMYCRTCWEHSNVVGPTNEYNGLMMCTTCINNTPPIEDIYDNVPEITNHDEATLIDEYIAQNNVEYEPWPVIDYIDDEIPIHIPLFGPPIGFDMNMASLVEENPDYMNNLINAQVEYEGKWYFVLDNQIYVVPYEIEIDDDYVRQDIRDNWENVEWAGSIFGNYIAWY